MDMFVLLPKPEHIEHADLQLLLSAFLLMKVGGQESASMSDIKMLATDYSGFTVHYDQQTDAFTFKLRVRPEEHPIPEPV